MPVEVTDTNSPSGTPDHVLYSLLTATWCGLSKCRAITSDRCGSPGKNM